MVIIINLGEGNIFVSNYCCKCFGGQFRHREQSLSIGYSCLGLFPLLRPSVISLTLPNYHSPPDFLQFASPTPQYRLHCTASVFLGNASTYPYYFSHCLHFCCFQYLSGSCQCLVSLPYVNIDFVKSYVRLNP